MNFPKFQTCLLALTVGLLITNSSCTKEKVAPSAHEDAVLVQKDATNSKTLTTRGAGASANGQGALMLDYMNGRVQHFAFHASTDANGIVTGSFESKSPGQDGRAHGTINCLTVSPDGKTAIMSGVVTHVVGDGYLGFGVKVGTPIWLKVEDNGQGANVVKDRFTDFYFLDTPLLCNEDLGISLAPILNGNIQVKP